MFDIREHAEKALKKQNYWNQNIKKKLDKIIVERFPKFVDTKMWEEKAKQHPYRYRRNKKKEAEFTKAQKQWIEKAKANAEIIKRGDKILGQKKNPKTGKMEQAELTRTESAKSMRTQAKKNLPHAQYEEIREEFDEIHRDIERAEEDRFGRMNKDSETFHKMIPEEQDSDDEEWESREEPTFELDEDLDPVPIGAPHKRKHKKRPFSEKWYSRNNVSSSGSSGDSSSDWDEYSASDEERDEIPDDEDYRRAMAERDKYREYWRKKDEDVRIRLEGEEKGEDEDKDKENAALKAAKAAAWYIGGPITKGILTGLDVLDSAKEWFYNGKVKTPKVAKGTVFEPVFKAGKMFYRPVVQSSYDANADEDDPTAKWRRRNTRRFSYGPKGYRRKYYKRRKN
jgi:hypothetical protein